MARLGSLSSNVDLALVSTVTESTTARTLGLTDAGTTVECTNAAGCTVTVPANATVAFPVGTVIALLQAAAGTVTVAAGGGVTLDSLGGLLTSAGQYSTVTLRKRATDEWVVSVAGGAGTTNASNLTSGTLAQARLPAHPHAAASPEGQIPYANLSSVPSTFAPAQHGIDGTAHSVAGRTAGQALVASSASALTWGYPNQRRFKVGLYYAAQYTGNVTGSVLIADTLYYVPIFVGITVTFDRIGAYLSTAGATNCVLRLGIYADSGGDYPGAKVLDAGTVAADGATGWKTITISQQLSPGLYWLGIASQVATTPSAAVHASTTAMTHIIALPDPPSTGVVASYSETASGAFPANANTTATFAVLGPRVALRCASIP